MLETAVVAGIWAFAVVLLGALVIWRVDKYATAQLELKRDQQQSKEADKALARQERQTAADLAQLTLEETAELERSKKLLEAAEARTTAQVAESDEVIQAKITEEKAVIAARTEGRAIAAKERAIREGDSPTDMEVLGKTYETYAQSAEKNNQTIASFAQWAGKYALPQSPSQD
jgi:hypothetical protein